MCEKPFEGDSVRDHCHITGEYRGAAHNACNLKLRPSPKTTTIRVVFHNLRGYDFYLQALSKVEGRISCIPNNTEKYISFSLGQLRFIDSAQFLLASLDKLVAANKPEAFKITGPYEPSSERRELLLRKGVYPYQYMDSWEHFAEPKLPPKEASSASFETSTSVRMTTPMRKGCGRLSGVATWGTITTSTTAQTCSS